MRTFQIFSLLLFVFLAACAPGISTEKCLAPKGRYANTTVLDKCGQTMPFDIPSFCYELNFNKVGSVDVDNGFEKFNLPYVKTDDGCMYKILGATLFGDMYFEVDSDSSIQLIDTAWTKVNSFTTFKRRITSDSSSLSFEHQLNECILAEEYALFKDGNLQSGLVTLMANGQMNGLKPFLGYRICYAGDCLEETEPAANTVDFIDDKGNRETFVFKNIEGKMAIELYSIGPPIPDIKGSRSIGPMVYELRTE
jgi:hypothetical protein